MGDVARGGGMTDRRTLLDEMTASLGPELADAVICEWGGTRLWVPRRIGPGHPVAAALGLDAARRLAAWCGGGPLQVPTGAARDRARRDACIRRDRALGVTPAELALCYGLTEGRVYQILRQV